MDIPVMLPPGAATPMPTGGGGGPLTGAQDMNREDFLRMLVTQLSNQDPMNPLKGHEFAAQLAQFSSVEQLINLNDTLVAQGDAFNLLAETMTESVRAQTTMLDVLSQNMNKSAATSMIGMTVEVPGDTVAWSGVEGDTVPLGFILDGAAEDVNVRVRNAQGEIVAILDRGSMSAGRGQVEWEPVDNDGNPLPPGSYTFEADAIDAEGNEVGVTTLASGTLERVSFGPEGIQVWVNGQSVSFDDIVSVAPPPEEPEPQVDPVATGGDMPPATDMPPAAEPVPTTDTASATSAYDLHPYFYQQPFSL